MLSASLCVEASAVVDLQGTLGTVIRRERRSRRRTMRALASEAALSTVYLGEIERGKKYPSAAVIEQLARALGLELSQLLELVADALRDSERSIVTRAVGFQAETRSLVPRVTITHMRQPSGPTMSLDYAA